MGFLKRWLGERSAQDRRRAKRQPLPGLIAYYWTGGTSTGKYIRDISSTGLFLLTDERWYPGTVLRISLQRTDEASEGTERSITVQAMVVRSDNDGVGFAFLIPDSRELQGRQHLGVITDKETLDRFLLGLKQTDTNG